MPRALFFSVALVCSLGCSDYGPNNEAVGNLTVVTTTVGTPDPDGFTLAVTGQAPRAMAANDTTVYLDLPIGDYTVTLGDVDGGCTVTDGAARNVYQTIGNKSVAYQVACP